LTESTVSSSALPTVCGEIPGYRNGPDEAS